MTLTAVTLGLVASSAQERDLLRGPLRVLGLRRVVAEADEYCGVPDDRTALQMIEAAPEVIIVDLQRTAAAVRAIEVLHAVLPQAWILAVAPVDAPALIIDAVRAGAREFLTKPVEPAGLSTALGRYLNEKERGQKRDKGGEVYCVTTAKGGSGATSVALNLATALAELPETRVAVLDLNSPMGDAAAYLDLSPRFTAADALDAAGRLDPVLLESYMSHSHGLAVLPGPKDFRADFWPGATGAAGGAASVARLLEVASHSHSHTVVDMPAALDREILRVLLDEASRLLVVLTPELPALWRTQRLLGVLQAAGGGEKLQLVLNRARRSDEITESEIEKTLGHTVYWQLPNDYKAAINAVNAGRPLVTGNHTGLAGSYKGLARQLSRIAPPPKRGGLLHRMLASAAWRREEGTQLPQSTDAPART
jgi:pilus assembly protein CpaE